jgi:hypothetical protein
VARTRSHEPSIRATFVEVGLWFAQAAAALPGVKRIAVIGSILTGRRDPKDIDFLVTVTDAADLSALAALGRRLIGRLQSHSHGADVFLANERGQYIGRTCSWVVCRPGIRASCDALNCGRRPYLHDDLNTVRLDDTVVAKPPLELWPVVVRRCEVPDDVERLVAGFDKPHNQRVQRTHSRVTPRAERPHGSRHAARR